MRARIDISEIEAETKIRAKYLRALENEEWGLLPGPAYVRSFLRTYAEALDLDAKLLLEEYKLRHERPSDHDLMPIGAPRRRSGGRGGRGAGRLGPPREPRRLPVGVLVGVILVLLVAALYFLGRGAGDDGGDGASAGQTQTSRTTTTRLPASTTTSTSAAKKKKAATKKKSSTAASRLVRVVVVATGPGPVSTCLVDAGGRARIPGATLQEGVTTDAYRSKSFRLLLGNGNARLRVDGKVRNVPDASPVAFRISKGSVRRVAPDQVPDCG